MDEKLLYTTDEASEMLNVSKTTIYSMVKRGVLGHLREEGGKGPSNIYIPKEELDKYIHSRIKYGHTVTLPPQRREEAVENLKKARDTRSSKGRKMVHEAPLESVEGTIYALGLKSRTFNLLYAAGLLRVDQVNLHDPEVARRLACLPRFGVACWTDLEQRLTAYLAEKVEATLVERGA